MRPKLEKELKQPDQFVSFWSRLGAWAGPRRKKILGTVLGAVATGGIVWAVSAQVTGRSEHVSRDFARISRVAGAALIPAEGEAPKFTDGLPHFKTEKERNEEALKEADKFLASGGSSLREEALVLKARLLVTLGRAAAAIPVYQELTSALDPQLRFLAQEGLAYALEEAGQLDKALETLATLADQAKGAGNFFRDRALYNKARLLERKGSAKDAEKVYREILSELPTTTLKDEINNRLAVLEGK